MLGGRPAVAGPPPLAPAGESVPIFFVVGRGKSGTSWLMNLLDEHPQVLCRGEGRFFGPRHRMGAAKSRSLESALYESEGLREWASRSGWTRRRDYEATAGAWTALLVRATMGGALAAAEAEIVGDKSPLYGPGVVSRIGELLPEARVIHIIRDGRDVAVSSVHHRWNELGAGAEVASGRRAELETRDAYRSDPGAFIAAGRSIFGADGPGEFARTWAELTVAAAAEGRELGTDRYAEVRYEQLLASGAEELVRLFGFLGVETSAEQARRCLGAQSFERASGGRPAGVEDSAAFLRSGVAGDWRRVFTAEDRERFKRSGGEALIALGYEPDRDW